MKKTEGYRIRKLEDEYVVLPFGKRAEEVKEVISLRCGVGCQNSEGKRSFTLTLYVAKKQSV